MNSRKLLKTNILKYYLKFLNELGYENVKLIKKKERQKRKRSKIWQSILYTILFHLLDKILSMDTKIRKTENKIISCEILNLNIKTLEDNERQLKKGLLYKYDFSSHLAKGIGFLRKFNYVKSHKTKAKIESPESRSTINGKEYNFLDELKTIILKEND